MKPSLAIDTLVLIAADPGSGKSSQIRSIFTQPEFCKFGRYPTERKIPNIHKIGPDILLYVRLTSWHETKKVYPEVVADIQKHAPAKRRYKVLAPVQVTASKYGLAGAEELFMKLMRDFRVRRGLLVWLSPNVKKTDSIAISKDLANFLSKSNASSLTIDSNIRNPAIKTKVNNINARLICDFLFRV